MKYFLLIISCAFFLQLNAQQTKCQGDTIRQWSFEWQKQFLSDRENPEKWDSAHFVEDLQNVSTHKHSPMRMGVFPTPSYDLYPGTFDGIIAANLDINLPSGQRIACTISGNSKTSLNESIIGDNDVDFYFILAVVTDLPKDTINYDDVNIDGVSRNHPDVISQGYVRTSQTDKVDFVAFKSANNDAYAVVNMRLFNLNNGCIVIVVPHEDGSLRSMQIKPDELLSFQTLRSYLTSLFTEDIRINKFITTRCDDFRLLNTRQ